MAKKIATPEGVEPRTLKDWYHTFVTLGKDNGYDFMFSPYEQRRIAKAYIELFELATNQPLRVTNLQLDGVAMGDCDLDKLDDIIIKVKNAE